MERLAEDSEYLETFPDDWDKDIGNGCGGQICPNLESFISLHTQGKNQAINTNE